ncbi:hypothetical protein RND81_06G060700 [Saponaria officinalis]|uniref:Protein kinase domain-containing protein n=1 Tax=Saponaria officinalis TaxID=3572 RepID=A0AAW1K7P6_SAPOF
MVYKFCNAESAIATCDSYNYPPNKLVRKIHPPKLRRFTYAYLETATNGFSPSNLLGKGSHGAVYKAILDGGKLIAAVKRPSPAATLAAENEIEILPRIVNRRIVNLIGYAISDPNKLLLLVVEYMPNGSLYDLIHKNPTPPSWRARVRVALHVAEAVRTIHLSDPPVIHRDIKSSNVLLDRKVNARLSDFGLALRGHVDDMRVMSTPPAGTLGYLDPCYITPDDVSSKCDVFSFGILLLEIMSGRRAIDFDFSPPCFVEWARPLIKSGDYAAICDRRMRGIVDPTVIRELALLAVRCVRSTAEKRPPITEVVEGIKMVYGRVKLMKGVPTWQNLGRRVGRVERSQPLSEMDGGDHLDDEQKCLNASKHMIWKVSNVSGTEGWVCETTTRGEHRTVILKSKSKSKSVGSFREIIKDDVNCEISVNHLDKQRGNQVTVKLSKSRSMSVLQSSKNESYGGNNCLIINHEVKELDVVPLLVKLSRSKSSSPSGTQMFI